MRRWADFRYPLPPASTGNKLAEAMFWLVVTPAAGLMLAVIFATVSRAS